MQNTWVERNLPSKDFNQKILAPWVQISLTIVAIFVAWSVFHVQEKQAATAYEDLKFRSLAIAKQQVRMDAQQERLNQQQARIDRQQESLEDAVRTAEAREVKRTATVAEQYAILIRQSKQIADQSIITANLAVNQFDLNIAMIQEQAATLIPLTDYIRWISFAQAKSISLTSDERALFSTVAGLTKVSNQRIALRVKNISEFAQARKQILHDFDKKQNATSLEGSMGVSPGIGLKPSIVTHSTICGLYRPGVW